MNKSTTQLTKKDLMRFSFRYMLSSQALQNYETMQSCGVIYAMGPFLEKWYGDNPELLKEKFRTHFQFFNCQTYFGAAILAASLAIEETKADDASAIASAIKTSLMGPFSGIGDAMFNTLPKVVFAAMSGYAAIQGSALTGFILALVFGPLMILLRWTMIKIGYYQGAAIISERQGQLNNLREAISVLGIMVVGALIAANVKVTTPLAITVGEATQTIQDILDSIFPKLLSVLTVAAVYFGLDIKKMNTMKMVWIMILVALVLAYFGIIK